ncbi:MAG: hypothetical protein U0745_04430 [Polyangia bacterium]|jgi:hypothetical protein
MASASPDVPSPAVPTDGSPTHLIELAERLKTDLRVLIEPGRELERLSFLRSLQPTDSDYEQVFVRDAAIQARAFYQAMWQAPLSPSWNPRHSVIRIHVAQPEDFAIEHPRAAAFPQGYRGIVQSLVPSVPWACFELLEEGDSLGVSTDGVVLIGSRLRWFPRPFVALRSASRTTLTDDVGPT